MMTIECPSSDNHERSEETMYGSSLPLIKTVDAQAAPGPMSVPNRTDNRVVELNHWKDFRSRLSVEFVSAL